MSFCHVTNVETPCTPRRQRGGGETEPTEAVITSDNKKARDTEIARPEVLLRKSLDSKAMWNGSVVHTAHTKLILSLRVVCFDEYRPTSYSITVFK